MFRSKERFIEIIFFNLSKIEIWIYLEKFFGRGGVEIIFISGVVELSVFRLNNLRSYLTILGVIKLFIYMINIDRYIKLCKTIIKLGQIEMIQNRGKNRCIVN